MNQGILISAKVKIHPDGKYCDERCHYHKPAPSISMPAFCWLFGRPCEHCLGGGPLRCGACLEAEQKAVYTPRGQEQKVNVEEVVLCEDFDGDSLRHEDLRFEITASTGCNLEGQRGQLVFRKMEVNDARVD